MADDGLRGVRLILTIIEPPTIKRSSPAQICAETWIALPGGFQLPPRMPMIRS